MEFREEVKDYVMLMLGAPVIQLELDDAQINLCIDETTHKVDRLCGKNMRSKRVIRNYKDVIKEGSLCRAMMILGRIRSKYGRITGPSGHIELDGKDMYKDGVAREKEWEKSTCAEILSYLKTHYKMFKDYYERRFGD